MHSKECPACQGAALVSQKQVSCLKCGGKGTIAGETCGLCNGRHFLPFDHAPCAKCNGAGLIKGSKGNDTCVACMGSGFVELATLVKV